MNIRIGVDEAGRGPWAGPVYASLVVLSEEQETFLVRKGITDSKKLTEQKREKLFFLIKENSIYSKVKYLPAAEIDKIGIYKATIVLIKELVRAATGEIKMKNEKLKDNICEAHNDFKISTFSTSDKLKCDANFNSDSLTYSRTNKLKILIDGVFPNLELLDQQGNIVEHECIIKGDEKEPSISAASILAKVRRDHYMIKLHEKFPLYNFAKHKGYGTKLHSEKLVQFGPCEEHRKSFEPVRKLIINE